MARSLPANVVGRPGSDEKLHARRTAWERRRPGVSAPNERAAITLPCDAAVAAPKGLRAKAMCSRRVPACIREFGARGRAARFEVGAATSVRGCEPQLSCYDRRTGVHYVPGPFVHHLPGTKGTPPPQPP